MTLQRIQLHTAGLRIGIDLQLLEQPVYAGLSQTSENAHPATGHTKILAEGTHVAGDDPRTDHVAVIDHQTGLMWAVQSIGAPDSTDTGLQHAQCAERCAALRLLGFGDEYCTSTDPIDYAKRWLAERLREDTARADAERRLAKIEVELGHVRARSSILKGRKRSDFVRLDAPIASAVNIREPVDVAAQLTNMLETALQEAKALQAILDRGNS